MAPHALRGDGGIFFDKADYVQDQVLAAADRSDTRAIVLDMETVPWTEVTGVHLLRELAEELDRAGVRLAIARSVWEVRDLKRREVADVLRANMYPSVLAAVRALRAKLEEDVTVPGAAVTTDITRGDAMRSPGRHTRYGRH